MLNKLLKPEVQAFIKAHEKTAPTAIELDRLLFNKNKYPHIPISLVVNQIKARKKAKLKLPLWFKTEGIIMPPLLSIEQSSSEETAKYKAQFFVGSLAIDLTGGTGVDTYYLSKQFRSVIYVESNKNLAEIAKHNFAKLGVTNIKVVHANGDTFITEFPHRANLIYIDPARRGKDKKLFLLEDCSPNVLKLQESLFKKSNHVMLKASPMLDIKKGVLQLKYVREAHVIAIKNEVKELLFIQSIINKLIGIKIVAKDLYDSKTTITTFHKQTKTAFSQVCRYLYEPNAAILKSGKVDVMVFKLSKKIFKLNPNTHLFTADMLLEEFPGRKFKVNKVVKYDKKEIKKHIPYMKANITVRNFPDSVDQIRNKIGIKEGGSIYIFAVRDLESKAKILICSKI